ncbi:MAG TPA: hypothetical protein VFS23_01705, partial [Vicinamibacterales bacterium]|nr:hypothetical protein [Vicinamibacterales bacterium]
MGDRHELAPFDELPEQDKCDSRRIVRAARSDLTFDATGNLLSKGQAPASCVRDRNISCSTRNSSARRLSAVRNTCADDTVCYESPLASLSTMIDGITFRGAQVSERKDQS